MLRHFEHDADAVLGTHVRTIGSEGDTAGQFNGTGGEARDGEGGSVGGAERGGFEDGQVVRNLQAGVFVEEAVIELWTTTYSNNIGTGLVLGKGATGVIERNQFVNNSGISLDQVRSLIVTSSSFDNTPIGIESISSATC